MLKVDDLAVRFGGRHVLNGLSLSLERGIALGIIGPNGCGKTTFFNVLCGLLEPERGRVEFEDRDISRLPAFGRARAGFARVFQTSGLFMQMTLEENILTALESKLALHQLLLPFGKNLCERKKKAAEFLEMIGLQEHSKSLASNLSGGQQRLLEIARAIASGAKLLLLDEPTAGLSPLMKRRVADFLVELRERGYTMIIIEHDMNFIENICQRIAVMADGKIALDGLPGEIKHSEKLREIYFGSSNGQQ